MTEETFEKIPAWLATAAAVLMAVLVCVQIGIYKGRMLEREKATTQGAALIAAHGGHCAEAP